MIIKWLLTLILSFSIHSAISQSDPDRNIRFYGEVSLAKEYHFGYQYQKVISGSLISLNSSDFASQSSEVTLELGYYLFPKILTFGLGFGIYQNNTFSVSGAPLYTSLKYYFIPSRNSIILYSDFGLLLKLGNLWSSGDFMEVGIAHKIFFTQKLAGIVKMGINFRRFTLSSEPVKGSWEYLVSTGIQISAGLYF